MAHGAIVRSLRVPLNAESGPMVWLSGTRQTVGAFTVEVQRPVSLCQCSIRRSEIHGDTGAYSESGATRTTIPTSYRPESGEIGGLRDRPFG